MNQPSDYQSGEPQQRGDTPWRLIVFAVIAVVTVIFILQNRERTNIDFLFIEFKARVWTSLLIALALGIVLDRLFQGWWRRRRAARD